MQSLPFMKKCSCGRSYSPESWAKLPLLGTITVGHWPALAVIALMLTIGLVIGFINGWSSERFKVQSFITTLAMLSIARGLAHIWSQDNSIPLAYGPGLGDPLFKALGQPLATAPSAPDRALRQAERAISETLEHHAHVRLRAAA